MYVYVRKPPDFFLRHSVILWWSDIVLRLLPPWSVGCSRHVWLQWYIPQPWFCLSDHVWNEKRSNCHHPNIYCIPYQWHTHNSQDTPMENTRQAYDIWYNTSAFYVRFHAYDIMMAYFTMCVLISHQKIYANILATNGLSDNFQV